jgi:cell division protein FtsB
MHFDSRVVEILFYVLGGVAALVLLFVGYKVGAAFASRASNRLLASREQELFTAQKGFKNLYEREIEVLKGENGQLKTQVDGLNKRVEEYRKKAAGFGGLFNAGGKKADAMYALLLENEALEEALYSQNEKLRQERTDSLKEQMRATGYRRVLMSQLLSDDRIKGYVAEILHDDRQLPPAQARPDNNTTRILPPDQRERG